MKHILPILIMSLVISCAKTSNDGGTVENPPLISSSATPEPTSTPLSTPTPTPTPSPSPTPTPTPMASAKWSSIYNEYADSTPGDCEYPLRFGLFGDSRYVAGPCHGILREGKIKASEFSRLVFLANRLIEARDETDPVQCEQIATDVRESIDLTNRHNVVFRPFAEDERGRCYDGNFHDVDEFRFYVRELRRRYYPSPDATPTPTPSPSPSPSPSSSPNPSPTVTPQ